MNEITYKIHYQSFYDDGRDEWTQWACDKYRGDWSKCEKEAIDMLKTLRATEKASRFRLQRHETTITELEI